MGTAVLAANQVGLQCWEFTALVLDSELDVAGEPCSISFLLLPNAGGVFDLLAPLGLAEAA